MAVHCHIKFGNIQDEIVYAGQNVNGSVDIIANNVVKVKKVVLYIEGIGECKWPESQVTEYSNENRKCLQYKGKHQYLNDITYLIPNQIEIQPGRYTYNFMFEVPEEVPSSVEEKNGEIYYRARVVFDCLCKNSLEFKKDFVVVRSIDLNLDPKLRSLFLQEQMKHYYFNVCFIILSASVPKTGYVVGQKIPVKVIINNRSYINILHVELSLVKQVTYTSINPCNIFFHEEVEICRMEHGSSFSMSNKEYKVELEVPQTVPSTVSPLGKIINIQYKLNVKAKTPRYHKSPRVSFPITIGTIAIGQQNFVSHAAHDNEFINAMTPAPSAPKTPALSAPKTNEPSNIMMAPIVGPSAPPMTPIEEQFLPSLQETANMLKSTADASSRRAAFASHKN